MKKGGLWLIIGIWLLSGAVIYYIIKKWDGAYFDKNTWQIVAAIGTWLLAIGVAFAFNQLQQARASTNAQLALELFRELRSEKSLEIVRFIYSLDPRNVVIVYTNDYRRIDYILDRFDVLAVLVRQGVIDLELAVDAYAGVTVLRCWYILYGLIYEIREERKYFGHNIEGFANDCIKYFDKNHIEIGFKNKYTDIDNLVMILQDARQEKDIFKRRIYPRKYKDIRKQRKSDYIKKHRE